MTKNEGGAKVRFVKVVQIGRLPSSLFPPRTLPDRPSRYAQSPQFIFNIAYYVPGTSKYLVVIRRAASMKTGHVFCTAYKGACMSSKSMSQRYVK
jgi:hypothetical protein